MNTIAHRHSLARVTVRVIDWLLLAIAFVAGLFLAATWGSLDTRARLAVVTLTILTAAGHQAIRHTRHR